jgi:hypothetical protein
MAHLRVGLAAFLVLVSSAVAAQSALPPRFASPAQAPGLSVAILKPVTPEESERQVRARRVPAGVAKALQLNPDSGAPLAGARVEAKALAGGAPIGPFSYTELARALKNDPDLIYEYVRNNIEYYPVWGTLKGAAAVLDNVGTAFDQAALMVTLLREAGFTATYIKGGISLSAAQVGDWLGIDTSNVCAVRQLLANGQIPASLVVNTPVDCNLPSPPVVPLISANLSHVWVKVIIGGNPYYFDPSYKPHTFKNGIDLAAASGYNAATYLTQAKSGATITANYVQGMNRTNIRNNLTSYATTLASYLRTNYPAGVLEDVVGGMAIVPYTGAPLRQASLSYQNMSVALEEWDPYIPNQYKPWVTIDYEGITNQSFQSPLIYGQRLTITYNASNQPVLMLNGAVVATGNPVAPGTVSDITFTITHVGSIAYQKFSQKITAGGTYVISNGWGPAGRGPVDLYRKQLDEARAAGSADTSEVVMGSSLAVLSATWIAQLDAATYIADRLAKTNTLFYHKVGIAGYNGSSYVDLPGNIVSVSSQSNDKAKVSAAIYNTATHLSILESTAVQQTSGVKAVSTVKLVDIASTNNYRIYDATSGNHTGVVEPNLVACSSYLGTFNTAISANNRLILPDHCDLGENSWSGAGYFQISADQLTISSLINGNLKGGFSTIPQLPTPYVSNTFSNSLSPAIAQYTIGNVFGEPIDMKTGNYLYNSDDMKVGVGSYPHALTFQKIYSSGARTQKGPLGMGWGHNFDASTVVSSDGLQGMGADSALDAATTLVEMMVSLDLLSDTAKPLDKLVIATLGQRWFGD